MRMRCQAPWSAQSGSTEPNPTGYSATRQRFGPNSDPYCKAVNTVISAAMKKLQSEGTTFVDVHIDNLDHYLTYTQTYMQRSRSDINEFLATKPHLPQDIADIIPAKPSKSYFGLLGPMAHGPLDPKTDPTYVDRLLQRDELKRKVDCLIASLGLDALTLPDVQIPPPHFKDWTENGRFEGKEFPTNTFLASQTRLPAVTLPAGFTENGLPVGIQFIGLEHQEQHLLELARGVEVLVGARKTPPEPL